MSALRFRRRSRRRLPRAPFLAGLTALTGLASALERATDDSATLCACDDGRRCVA